ncbi:hypothetical protein GGF32_001441 [Allomyces javanicus]|nr:hypothetical protein GGF32_001441 [Allomyces javanicus]
MAAAGADAAEERESSQSQFDEKVRAFDKIAAMLTGSNSYLHTTASTSALVAAPTSNTGTAATAATTAPPPRHSSIKPETAALDTDLVSLPLVCLRSILSALDSSTISRLHKTWESLSGKRHEPLEEMRLATDHARNDANFWAALTFMSDGNPDRRGPDLRLISFDKHAKTARTVTNLLRIQVPFALTELMHVRRAMQDDLYYRSLVVERAPKALS